MCVSVCVSEGGKEGGRCDGVRGERVRGVRRGRVCLLQPLSLSDLRTLHTPQL